MLGLCVYSFKVVKMWKVYKWKTVLVFSVTHYWKVSLCKTYWSLVSILNPLRMTLPNHTKITSQSISWSLAVKFNTSYHHFFTKLLSMLYKLLKNIIFLVSTCTTFNCNIVKVWHFSSINYKIKSSSIASHILLLLCFYRNFFALSQSWELVFLHWIT